MIKRLVMVAASSGVTLAFATLIRGIGEITIRPGPFSERRYSIL